jgi:hypothetical protein
MGGVAVVAIILAIVVAIKTFSDPTSAPRNPPTETISGKWTRTIGQVAPEIPPGAPAEYMILKDITAFDASNAMGSTGTVALTFADGSVINAKVMVSEIGNLMVQVPTKSGKLTQISISMLADGGPLFVSDGIASMQFDPAK